MIRPGRDDDSAGYITLIAGCWGEYPGVAVDVAAEVPEIGALATALAGRGGALWTAEAAGRVVGMVATYPAPDGWHLSRMYVAAGQRGTGLGHALLAQAEDHARAAGAVRMVLWSDVLFTRAHAFYEKHGYVRRGGLRALHDVSNTIEAGYAKPLAGCVVEALDIAAAESAERPLAALLQACTASGAAGPFLPPLARDKALAYWRGVTKAVGQGDVRLLVAWRDGVVAGAAQLDLAMPEPQRHRADLRHLMVPPGSPGLARMLLAAAEAAARDGGRRLLVMDTRADDGSQPPYIEWGWSAAGSLPGAALDAEGAAHDTVRYCKRL